MTSCNVHTVIRDFEDVTNLIVVDTVRAIKRKMAASSCEPNRRSAYAQDAGG